MAVLFMEDNILAVRESFEKDMRDIENFYGKRMQPEEVRDFMSRLWDDVHITGRRPISLPVCVYRKQKYHKYLVFKRKFLVFYRDTEEGIRVLFRIRHHKKKR